MKSRSALWLSLCLLGSLMLWPGMAPAQGDSPAATSGSPHLTCAEMEEFLRTADVGALKNIPKGVTLPKRATLTSKDGKFTHDAAIQTIHESKNSFTTSRGTELNFKDWWEFNVAGYELAKLLGLNMVPPYVDRKEAGRSGSFSWWIDNSIMELDRLHKKMDPPDLDFWNKQMYTLRVFNQLVENTDDNLTNVMISDLNSKEWRIWMIDFTRAFRTQKNIGNVKNLVQCDRRLLAKMRELDKPTLKEHMGRYLTSMEIDGLLARRDKIVKFFDDEVKKKGEGAVLFDLPQTSEACGVGL
ncbi:MAG TPA: hypothetical protein VEU62_17565 [Bryobacterales bacterium]|nr:hypothetical protein [Bryobacterales bacterium]